MAPLGQGGVKRERPHKLNTRGTRLPSLLEANVNHVELYNSKLLRFPRKSDKTGVKKVGQ